MTIFSIPKPFTGPDISLIQRNAFSSWRATGAEVFIMGDEESVREEAESIGAKHFKEARKNEYGTPFLNDTFRLAEENSSGDILMYSNADIIFFADLIEVVKNLPKGKFLAVGRRTDLDIAEGIDFSKNDEVEKIKKRAKNEGKLHSPAGIDYFIFRKGTLGEMPPLIVGRIGWDNWMIYNAKKNNIPVIDMTKEVLAIHQNHPPKKVNAETRKTNPEALHNISFIKGRGNACTIEDADYRMVGGKLIKNYWHWFPKVKRIVRSFIKF